MEQHSYIRKALIYLLICFTLSAVMHISAHAAPDRPNIIIVLTDDMGYSDLGCYGGEIETPNMDGLAENGLRFTNFYNTARCWPTRATLMSGIYSSRLSDVQVTIAEVLRDAGYETGMIGKWHLGGNPEKNGPIQRGFDQYYGTLGGAGSYWLPPKLVRNTEFIEPEGEDYYYTDKLGEEAAKQIEDFSTSDKPFFQYVAFTAAHWPLHAPEETIQKYIKRYEQGWQKIRNDRYKRMLEMGIINEEQWPLPPMEPGVSEWESIDHKSWRTRNQAVYAAMVDHMDQAMGQIVYALKQTGQLDNTLIVYTHDNGACHEHLHGDGWGTAGNVFEWAEEQGKTVAVGDVYDVPMGGPYTYGSVGHNWANAQNTPLRRYKANVHEGGACTPCIMHWPDGMEHRGTITRQRGHVVDLMATCVELAKTTYPETFQGHEIVPNESLSLVPVMTGGEQPKDHPYYFNHNGTQALIAGDWKVVHDQDSPWHLFNLSDNRTETTDYSAQYPELFKEMIERFETWKEELDQLPNPLK